MKAVPALLSLLSFKTDSHHKQLNECLSSKEEKQQKKREEEELYTREEEEFMREQKARLL